ncbi:SDR family oxidoreductase [Lacticaseibacillus saniviri]|uniref:Carbonyl reductase n=1 Tax=Lacticaseibacillus saniviri JCM 17471 = DSM 24301 TaxID=1293598 RepID=A0A0R2MW54_9LACO|nr:SDR family oxidoreductase [Lacticaseibacillus saniviri]KRO17652.1 carbonyl reductase [Lacticaseibacillus saniviri JCM 17471 = DSM 24301]MCG4282572.1 SDR family oxidoreductase [Lacticaseibacillus saniviri]
MTQLTLITGANRGMGFEIAKALGEHGQHILLGARNAQKGEAAAQTLRDQGMTVDAIQLDVTNHESITQAVAKVTADYGHLDILINNAGAAFDAHRAPSILDLATIQQDFEINYFGLVDVTQQFIPLLKQSPSAKIINVTSMMGSLSQALNPESEVFHASAVGYQSAKAAANMFTIQLAKEFQNTGVPITVNSVDPGVVATHFGGGDPEMAKSRGAKTPAEGAKRTIELALDDSKTTATFSNTNGIVPW